MIMNWKSYLTLAIVGLLGHGAGTEVSAGPIGGPPQGRATGPVGVSREGNVTVFNPASMQAQMGGATIDYVNAQPMELPRIPPRSEAEVQSDMLNTLMPQQPMGVPSYSPGKSGNGVRNPIDLGAPQMAVASDDGVSSQEFGTNNHPFSTARADLSPLVTNTSYPYRASGKLFFNIGASTYVCSASLIKRGVVVTAAHCVANFGHSQFYSNWSFVPGYRNGVAPYGTWSVAQARVLTSYYNGTDPCTVAGIVCQDDVAVLVLRAATTGATYPGTSTGWYGYGVNGYGFTADGLTHLTQIGYPVCLDNGGLMERNDSQGVKTPSQSNNTVIGSLMCGGSSGGPWLVNFGIRPVLTATTDGTAPQSNVVVGVTSWGYTSTSPKEQGASPFLSTNLTPLLNAACLAIPAACS